DFVLPDSGTTFSLTEINGTVCIFGGGTACTIDGKSIPGFRGKLPSGFSASAADINGDGKPYIFEVTQRHGVSNAVVVAVDSTGKALKGWPQKIGGKSFALPSIGNVF